MLPDTSTFIVTSEDAAPHIPKYSKRCGRWVTGPSGANKKFYAMTLVNMTLCALIFSLDYLNILSK